MLEENGVEIDNTLNITENNMSTSDYLVAFSGQTQHYCVGMVDMANSTKMTATLGTAKISRYYQVFLNSMSKILSRFGGFVIKNIGDCLLYYFPESSNPNKKFGFMSCLECSLSMIENHTNICRVLNQDNLPCVDYRISLDYGSVVIMRTNNSQSVDMLGPPVNMCCKINHAAVINGAVLGGDLYTVVKNFDDYRFKKVEEFSLGFKHSYPIYSIERK